jgi:hypothetical protein
VRGCPLATEYTAVNDLVARVIEKTAAEDATIHSFLTSDLGAPLPLHISLSRPIGFPTEDKDNFVGLLEQSVNTCGIRP